jgi:hypothetical protein
MVDVSGRAIAKESVAHRLAAGWTMVRNSVGGRAPQFVSVLSDLALIVSDEGFESEEGRSRMARQLTTSALQY